MDKQTEILEAVKTCIAIEQSCGDFDGNRLALNILKVEEELGVCIKVDGEMPVNKYNSSENLDHEAGFFSTHEMFDVAQKGNRIKQRTQAWKSEMKWE